MPESAPRQGRFRYRLSWLLVLITLTCLFFGRQTYLARQQERALTLIEQAGGHPSYSYEFDEQGGQLANPENPYPAWLRSMLGEEHFRTPVRVGLSDGGRRQRFSQPSTVTPEVMAAVGTL